VPGQKVGNEVRDNHVDFLWCTKIFQIWQPVLQADVHFPGQKIDEQLALTLIKKLFYLFNSKNLPIFYGNIRLLFDIPKQNKPHWRQTKRRMWIEECSRVVVSRTNSQSSNGEEAAIGFEDWDC
jgi:hypothetical protein